MRVLLPRTFGSTISMGLVAFAISLPAEIAGVVWVRRLSLHDYLGSLVTARGLVSLLMFLLLPQSRSAAST